MRGSAASARIGRCFALLSAIPILAGTVEARDDPARLTADERNTTAVFREASRGVVHVESRATTEARFEKGVIEAASGSGFVIDADGRILTNFHVVNGKNEVDVVLGSGRRVSARLIGTVPQLDVALLQVDAPRVELFPLPLGDSRSLQVGQKVLAIGNPFGLHNTLTVGVVSALDRSVPGVPVELKDALIQTDAAINPGNSGGPLLDSSGAVVGINTLGGVAQGLGFAVPIHLARRVVGDLVAMGHAYRPDLGLEGAEITPAIARLFGLPVDRGILVEGVIPRSPAARAGLRAGERIIVSGDKVYALGGDVVTGINGEPVTSAATLARVLLEAHPGDVLRLTVDRSGQSLEILVPLEEMRMRF
jgi:S1-C subfamily serine protease